MKLFSYKTAPNVRKITIFLKEKGISPPYDTIEIDLMNGEQYNPEFKKINPLGKVPTLELDDGSYVTESLPIVEYFEELYPDTPLIGDTPEERAKIRSLERYIDMEIMGTMGIMAQNMMPLYADRFDQSPVVVQYGIGRQAMALTHLNDLIGDGNFVFEDKVTIADITLFVTLESAFIVNAEIDPKYKNIVRCYENFMKRPSAALQ